MFLRVFKASDQCVIKSFRGILREYSIWRQYLFAFKFLMGSVLSYPGLLPLQRHPWWFSLMLTCFWLSVDYDWCPTMSYLAARHVPVFLCKNRFLLTRVCVCNNIKLASNVLHKIHTYKSMYVYFYAGLLTLTLCSRIDRRQCKQ